MANQFDPTNPTGSVRYVDPDGLNKNPAFTNVVVVEGPARTVYVGGQDSVDASGSIVGKGDIAAQTEQVLANVRAALAAGGAGPEHVIKWNLFVVEGMSLQEGYSAFQRAWVATPNPPAITMAFVAGLAHPDFLVEMDAIAVVPQGEEREHDMSEVIGGAMSPVVMRNVVSVDGYIADDKDDVGPLFEWYFNRRGC